MARKYTKVEAFVETIMQRHESGETYREISVSLGLSRAEVRGAVKRWRRKERKIAAGYKPLPKGRPRKDADNTRYSYHPAPLLVGMAVLHQK